jgi:hypothetical protein
VRLVVSEHPLMFSPSLAKAVGLDGAVFLQQLHYWLTQLGAHERDGHRWVYNTVDQWLEQFPFWSRSALHRVISGLESRGLVVSTATYNDSGGNRTKWYRIAYDHPDLEALTSEHQGPTEPQNPSNGAISHIRDMGFPNPGNGISKSQNRDIYKEHKTTTETTTEKKPPLPPKGERASRAKAKTSWPEGFTLTDDLWRMARAARIRADRVDAVFEGFRDAAEARGYRYVDWNAAWRNWVKSPFQDHDRETPASTPAERREDPASAARRAAALESDIRHMEKINAPDWKVENVRRELDKARRAMEATA